MKLLIEIDDIDFEAIKHGKPISAKVMDALIHGTPLPKGHGRLIDADALKEDLNDCQYSRDFCREHYIDYSIHLGVANDIIDDVAQTIIEADKETEE